jgi:hypothetical protein
MKAITSNKWVLLLVVFLVLSNLALVFFAFSEARQDKKKPQENSFRSQLGLSEEQTKVFDQRKEDFFKVMKPRWAEVNKLKDSLYQHLGDETLPDSVIEDYTRRWTEISRQSDVMLFKHFRDLRKECKESQLPAFDSAVVKMVTRRRR